jgi:hypothetical protein
VLTLLAAAVALAAPVPKATSAELKWRFHKGDTCYVKAEIENVASLNAGGGGGGGAVQGTESGAEYVYKLTVTADDEKGATLELEFLSCKAGTSAGGGGGLKLADEPGVPGKKVTVTLDKANKVTKLDGAGKLGGPGVAAGLLAEEYLKHNLDDLIRAVPGKPLGKGDTFTAEAEATLAEDMVMKRTDRGTVAGTEDGFTRLEVETEQAMTGGQKNGITMDLKGDKGKRTVLFDPKAGRVRKVTEEYTMAGTVGIGGGGGAAQNIQMSMTLKATVTVTDDPPKGEK